MSTAQEFVHKNRSIFWDADGRKNDPDRCQYSVSEGGRGFYHYQCQKPIKEEVDGVGFCGQHAQEVKRRLGLLKPIKTGYAASFEHGSANLSLIHVAKETSRTIEITKVESILGSMNIWSGFVKKDSQYHKAVKFFDHKSEALLWLYQQSEDAWHRAEQRLDDAIEVMQNLKSMVLKESEDKE